MNRFDEIAEYAQTHDFSADMDRGVWEDDTTADPMVTTSLRLPKSLLDWVRDQAARQHVRPSTLLRQWLEQQRDVAGALLLDSLAARVSRLETAVFQHPRAS